MEIVDFVSELTKGEFVSAYEYCQIPRHLMKRMSPRKIVSKLVEQKKDNLKLKKPTEEVEGRCQKRRARPGLKGARARYLNPDSAFCFLERARAGPRRARAGYARILT